MTAILVLGLIKFQNIEYGGCIYLASLVDFSAVGNVVFRGKKKVRWKKCGTTLLSLGEFFSDLSRHLIPSIFNFFEGKGFFPLIFFSYLRPLRILKSAKQELNQIFLSSSSSRL